MPVNWKDPEVKDRVLAAIIASFDNKINCKEVARYFGGDATYNAIENFLRKPKQKAIELKKGAGSEVPASPAKPKQKKNVTEGVKTGRVTKTKKTTGTSRSAGSPIKKEILAVDLDESLVASGGEAGSESQVDDDDVIGEYT